MTNRAYLVKVKPVWWAMMWSVLLAERKKELIVPPTGVVFYLSSNMTIKIVRSESRQVSREQRCWYICWASRENMRSKKAVRDTYMNKHLKTVDRNAGIAVGLQASSRGPCRQQIHRGCHSRHICTNRLWKTTQTQIVSNALFWLLRLLARLLWLIRFSSETHYSRNCTSR